MFGSRSNFGLSPRSTGRSAASLGPVLALDSVITDHTTFAIQYDSWLPTCRDINPIMLPYPIDPWASLFVVDPVTYQLRV